MIFLYLRNSKKVGCVVALSYQRSLDKFQVLLGAWGDTLEKGCGIATIVE
mgnify:FL=1